MLLKKPVFVFVGIIAALAVAASLYVRTRHFADIVKIFAFRHVPASWGVKADFESLSIGMFPPTISVHHPVIQLQERNLTNLPADSVIRAERLDLAFSPFQSLSRTVRVREVGIVGGEVSLHLDRGYLRE